MAAKTRPECYLPALQTNSVPPGLLPQSLMSEATPLLNGTLLAPNNRTTPSWVKTRATVWSLLTVSVHMHHPQPKA